MTAKSCIEGGDVHFHAFEHGGWAVVISSDPAFIVFPKCNGITVEDKRSSRVFSSATVRLFVGLVREYIKCYRGVRHVGQTMYFAGQGEGDATWTDSLGSIALSYRQRSRRSEERRVGKDWKSRWARVDD